MDLQAKRTNGASTRGGEHTNEVDLQAKHTNGASTCDCEYPNRPAKLSKAYTPLYAPPAPACPYDQHSTTFALSSLSPHPCLPSIYHFPLFATHYPLSQPSPSPSTLLRNPDSSMHFHHDNCVFRHIYPLSSCRFTKLCYLCMNIFLFENYD